jgi:hypothetical protein
MQEQETNAADMAHSPNFECNPKLFQAQMEKLNQKMQR